ncbi:MAG: HDOD domain-containing protein [Gammaproteobacteria bacterium]
MFLNFFRRKIKAGGSARKPLFPKKSAAEAIDHSAELPLPFLKILVPLNQLLPEEIHELKLHTVTYPAGSVLFKTHGNKEFLAYLVRGELNFKSKNGLSFELSSDTLKALYPLSADKDLSITVTAKKESTVLYVPREQLNLAGKRQVLLFTDELTVPEQLKDNSFFKKFFTQFRHDALEMPALPDVAFKLHRAIEKELDISKIVKLIEYDPVIASKLIQVANSPYYRILNPIKDCQSAVTRIGLNASRNIVTSISLKNAYRIKTKNVNMRIHSLWLESLEISVLSYILATLTQKTDPGEALLAGLVCNIGTLPLLKFADSLPQDDARLGEELDYCIRYAQGMLGSLILEKWNFPDNLRTIPMTADAWYSDFEPVLNLTDIVILAKYHALLNSKLMHTLPLITGLPSFQKLEDQGLTPDMSLNILYKARQQISEAMSLFKS